MHSGGMADSVVAAAITKFGTLGFTPRPAIYFDDVPLTDNTGAQIYPPYVVVKDNGTRPEAIEAGAVMDTTDITFECYGVTLALADAIAEGVKYSTGAVQDRLGFDYGTLPALTNGSLNVIRRAGERRTMAGLTKEGGRAHMVEIRYEVEVRRG
jgi:hypothetical protein